MPLTRDERFALWKSHVRVSEDPDGCWEWTATLTRGYGSFWTGELRVRAHRYGYEMLVGPIADGLQLDHLCRNRCCVNPQHLEPVTPGENIRRGHTGKAAAARMLAKTHCPQGHPYAGENLYLDKNGGRYCRTCMHEAGKRRMAKVKAERTHCPSGHPYAGRNLGVADDGGRYCRICMSGAGKKGGGSRGQQMLAKTHCPKGHPYSGDNLIIRKGREGRGGRVCRACKNESYKRNSG